MSRLIVQFFSRYQYHVTREERIQMLSGLGPSLLSFLFPQSSPCSVYKDEDLQVLVHTSGQCSQAIASVLCMLSPIVQNSELTDSLNSLIDLYFDVFISGEEGDNGPIFEGTTILGHILTREFLACTILGLSPQVQEHLISRVKQSEQMHLLSNTESPNHRDDQSFLTGFISDPIARIEAIMKHAMTIDNKLILQSVHQSVMKFLNVHPDTLPQFLANKTIINFDKLVSDNDSVSIPMSDLLLSSSSPIASELLTTQFKIIQGKGFLLSNYQFDSHTKDVLFRIVEEKPDLLPFIVDNPLSLLEPMHSLLQSTVRVHQPLGTTPRCLSFGTDTNRWTTLVRLLSTTIQGQANSEDMDSFFNHFLDVLVMCAASTDDSLSETAISALSANSGLSLEQTKAILFDTPTTFPLLQDWPFQEPDPTKTVREVKGHSVCIDVADSLLRRIESDLSETHNSTQPEDVNPSILVLDSLVTVFNIVDSSVSPRFSFFSPDLCPTEPRASMWTDSNCIEPLRHFTSRIVNNSVLKLPMKSSEQVEMKMLPFVTTLLHLFPFQDEDQKTTIFTAVKSLISMDKPLFESKPQLIRRLLLDLGLAESYRTPISLITCVGSVVGIPSRLLLGSNLPQRRTTSDELAVELQVEFDSCSDDEDHWLAFTKLCAVNDLTSAQTNTMLMKAKNDLQTLLVLSAPSIRRNRDPVYPTLNSANYALLLKLAERSDNLELVSAAWKWIAGETRMPQKSVLIGSVVGVMEPNRKMTALILRKLEEMCARQREGLKDGQVAKRNNLATSLLHSCLSILHDQMSWTPLDPSPFIPVLSSLALTSDVDLLTSLYPVFEEIRLKTENSPTPFSISTFTVSFTPDASTPTRQTSLLSVFASSILSYSLNKTTSRNKGFLMGSWTIDGLKDFEEIFQKKSADGWTQFINCVIDIACDLIKDFSTRSCSNLPTRPLLLYSSFTGNTETPFPTLIWKSITSLLKPSLGIVPFDTLLQLTHSLTCLASVTLRAMPDWEEQRHQTFLSSRIGPFAGIHNSLCFSSIADINTHPSLLSLLRALTILCTRHERILSDSLDDILPKQHHNEPRDTLLHQRQTVSHSRLTLLPIVLLYLEEGVEDQCEKGMSMSFWKFCCAMGTNTPTNVPFTRQNNRLNPPIPGFRGLNLRHQNHHVPPRLTAMFGGRGRDEGGGRNGETILGRHGVGIQSGPGQPTIGFRNARTGQEVGRRTTGTVRMGGLNLFPRASGQIGRVGGSDETNQTDIPPTARIPPSLGKPRFNFFKDPPDEMMGQTDSGNSGRPFVLQSGGTQPQTLSGFGGRMIDRNEVITLGDASNLSSGHVPSFSLFAPNQPQRSGDVTSNTSSGNETALSSWNQNQDEKNSDSD
ncbi:hypothetical protein BLNAU_22239 [Blattamonas nauphoetae]|uniref:Uncharacterized protein n=1 Tax=Blattamonas nauphoetae TaxID=2049346 RepID=A0ABQ9WTK2_9EUKA|nr:hypothetical protein BLNAU_22239 [Blattamonas nauphoetae]